MNPVNELKKLAKDLDKVSGDYEDRLEKHLSKHDYELVQILKKLQPHENSLQRLLGDLKDNTDPKTQLPLIADELGEEIRDLFAKALEMGWPSNIMLIEDMIAEGDMTSALMYAYSQVEEEQGLV